MDNVLIYIMVGAIVLGGMFFAAANVIRSDDERRLAQTIAAAASLGIGATCMALFFAYGISHFLVSAEAAARQLYVGF